MTSGDLYRRLLREYKSELGSIEPVVAIDVMRWAVRKGWLKLPAPADPMKRLAEEAAKAWRDELRIDKTTGRPYRANHAVRDGRGQVTFWGDIDEQPRPFMQKAFQQRREQIVGDCWQLTLDLDHFNSARGEEPIRIVFDFTEDIEERKLADGADDAA